MVAVSTPNSKAATSIGRPEHLYPSPFFDVSKNFMPRTIQETFDWCQYYQLTSPLINSVTQKLATYPITDLVYEEESEGVISTYRDLVQDQLQLRTFLIEHNLDRYTYGNAFASVFYPFQKKLECPACKQSETAAKSSYKWKQYSFFIACKCGFEGAAKARDEAVRNQKEIRLIRWNPKRISIQYNEITGHTRYFYSMPRYLQNDIKMGKPEVIEKIPQAFIDALAKKKSIMLDATKVFHSRRPSISRDPVDTGWGAPLILPVLKDLFLIQVLRRAQEQVALEHVLPLRIVFPQMSTEGGNPYASVNLKEWQKEVETQITLWKQDSARIPVMPVPIGQQVVGGNGKMLLMHQEIRLYSEQIIAGLGVPVGFYYGEAQYSGASVNLRALENEFLGNRQDMARLVNFIHKGISRFLDIPPVKAKFKPFKMADDLQRAMFDFQLNQGQKISTRTFLQSRDYDYEKELELMKKELDEFTEYQKESMIAQATAQGEAQVIQAKYTAKAQEHMPQPPMGAPMDPNAPQGAPQEGMPPEGAPQDPAMMQGDPAQAAPQAGMPPGQGGAPLEGQEAQGMPTMPPLMGGAVDLFSQARKLSAHLRGMDDVARYQSLARLRAQNPQLYMLVNNSLSGKGAGSTLPAPLPEQRPPRAGPDRAQL